MLWAAFTLGTIGLLRSGKFALDDNESISSPKLLRIQNVSLEAVQGRTVLKLRLFNTKTDRKNCGVQVIVGETGKEVCAVSAMCTYLRFRQAAMPQDALFTFEDGEVLRRKQLISFTRVFLHLIGETSAHYAGHSFRVGGATDLARANVPDYEIQAAGRWTSDAFKRYLRYSDLQNIRRAQYFGAST